MALQDVLAAAEQAATCTRPSRQPWRMSLPLSFHGEISARIGGMVGAFPPPLASIGIMKEFLFRYREITHETRRLRAFHRILKTRSLSDAEAALATVAWHPFCFAPPG